MICKISGEVLHNTCEQAMLEVFKELREYEQIQSINISSVKVWRKTQPGFNRDEYHYEVELD